MSSEDELSRPVEPDVESMLLHLEYEEFLTARTLLRIIGGIDDLYEAVCDASSLHALQLERAERSRLRLNQVHTGNSIDLEFINGVPQLVTSIHSGVSALVGTGASIAATATLLIGAFRRFDSARRASQLGGTEVRRAQSAAALEEERAALSKRTAETMSRDLQSREALISGARSELLSRLPDLSTREIDRLVRSGADPLVRLESVFNSSSIMRISVDGQQIRPDESSAE